MGRLHRSIAGLALIVCCAPWTAAADDLEGCLDKAETQRAMERCAGDALLEARAKLADLLRAHYARLGEAETAAKTEREHAKRVRQLLSESQAAWLKSLDLDCQLQAEKWHGGTMMILERLLCEVHRTRDRVKELESAFEREEPEPN